MRKFLFQLVVFLFLVQTPAMLEGLLPFNFFPGPEHMKRYTAAYGSSFSDLAYFQKNEGNLVNNKEDSKIREVYLETDQFGFRNSYFFTEPDIILIGDSQINCAHVTQDSIISEVIMDKTDLKVNNVSIATPNDLLYLLDQGLVAKPKLVVFEKIEREIPYYRANTKVDLEYIGELKKFSRLNPFGILVSNFVSKYFRSHWSQSLRAKIMGVQTGKPSSVDSTIYFVDGLSVRKDFSKKEISSIAKQIKEIQNAFKERDIEMVFIPFPNKETVQWETVPLESQPFFLDSLASELNKMNIPNINPIKKLQKNNEVRTTYFKGDSHLNENGVRIFAQEILNYYNTLHNE